MIMSAKLYISRPKGRSPYVKLTPKQKALVGKRAAEHGVTSALRYFARSQPDVDLKESTVRRLKGAYLTALHVQ